MMEPYHSDPRATHSLQTVLKRRKLVDQQPSKWKKPGDEYVSYVNALPLDILYNGLGQALAKQVAKAARDPFFQENPSYWLYADLQDWLCSDHPQSPFQSGIDLLDAIRLADPRTYRIAVYEAMAWLKWHKQFAYAYLKDLESTPEKEHRKKPQDKKNRSKKQDSLLPLYQADRHLHHGRLPSKHAGLWYHKFCHDWVQYDESQLWYLGDDKLKWMEKIQGKTGSDRLIQRAVSRLEKLVQAQKGILLYCRTISRFITGIGLSPPTEVGFAWHPTLGTSYMPGSSLKGAIRSWARDWLKLDEKTCMRLFGSEPHKAQKQMGNVIFFDVLPTDRIRIEVDVITPHFDSYYQNPQKNPALEWFNPRPIPCLTVAEGQPFVFAIAPVRQDAQGQDDVLRIKKMILQALEWTGVGAKTAVGYGRFELVKERSFVDG